MRLLILSDIHGNRAALEAIQEPFDLCLCLGDIVDYGPEPAWCIDWVRQHAKYCVRGNHDHGVAQRVDVQAKGGFKYLTAATRPLHIAALSECDRRFLADMPLRQYVRIDDRRILMVHATPRDPMEEYAPPNVEFWSEQLERIEADIILCGHTHVQYSLQIGSRMVINPGSVGLPRDRDWRAGYAILEGDRVSFRRVEYDRSATFAALDAQDLPERAKAMLRYVYEHGRLVAMHPPAEE